MQRELSLDEIAEIRQQCPEMELEVFVHGALCIAEADRRQSWAMCSTCTTAGRAST